MSTKRFAEDVVVVPHEAKRLKHELMVGEDHFLDRKKQRKRKKGLYKKLVEQMEFYLGDANVSKSKYMYDKFSKSHWLDLDEFLKFNKLVGMLDQFFGRHANTDDLWAALKSVPSELLEIEEDENGKRRIKRTKPYDYGTSKDSHEGKTIYVERLPIHVDIDALKGLFEQYGKVVYVALPKYKHNGQPKGFAFVEFDQEEGAKKALEAYVMAKRKLDPDMDPAELQSIQSFHNEQEEAGSTNQAKSEPSIISKADDKKEEEEEKEDVEEEEEEDKEGGKKKKRKRKRKDPISQPHVTTNPNPLLLLQILPKTEWKRLRNKYLNLQRKNMAHSKMRINQFLEKQKEHEEELEEEEEEEKKMEFVPDIIIKFDLEDPIEDPVKVKQRVKAAVMEPVHYLDASFGAKHYFVRCASAEQAKVLSGIKLLGQGTVLSGQEEKEYWAKIAKDREEKMSGKVAKKKQKKSRGKMRVIKKFEAIQIQKQNSHVVFDCSDNE